jgi:thiaminase/transcriptional activator TenA
MKFSDQLWQSTASIYQAILAHPFNTELAAGTLALDKFKYYIQQDELYINAYARALAILSAKAPDSEMATDLLTYARDGVEIEKILHDQFFQKFDISPTNEQQPACFAYSNFLLATTAIEPFESGLAALLPCFWIYREVGYFIAKNAVSPNPFQAWIDTYTDKDYHNVVDRVIDMTDQVAETASEVITQKMRKVFIQSTRLELNFWHAAYTLEKWTQ